MRLLLAFAVLGLLVQERPAPPEGWFCLNGSAAPKDHKCECQRTCDWDPETKTVVEHEDAKCTVYCHRDHCKCFSECDSH